MLAKDIMKRDLITVRRSTTLKELIYMLQTFHTFPLIPVVDNNQCLIGTVSFNDIMDAFQPYDIGLIKAIPFLEREEVDIFELDITPELATLIVVDDIMDKNILFVYEDDLLENVYNIMQKHSLDKVPIVNHEQKLVGLIGIFNIFMSVFLKKCIVED